MFNHRSKVKWAKEVALPEVEQYRNDVKFAEAFNLVQKAEKYISKEPRFKELASWITSKVTVLTDPPDEWVETKGLLKENYGFFIDRYEVTNKQFKEFVDNGGYRNPKYWKNEFIENGKTITLEKALAEFTDKTGRLGPATWEAGDYPDGQDNYPVTGVSWFEAAAYAEYVMKSLPTTDHWTAASEFYMYSFINFGSRIFPLSNFNGKGPEPVGKNKGVNCFGAFDMAGNVREWCWNETESGRVIRGGGWDDPVYMYNTESQLPPFDRSPKNGLKISAGPSITWKPAKISTAVNLGIMELAGVEN